MKNNSLARDWDNDATNAPIGPGAVVTTQNWNNDMAVLRMCATLIQEVLHRRAKILCGDAGLDANLLGGHPHNAMCAYEQGTPWDGIDYNRVFALQELLKHEFDGNRVLDAYDKAVRLDPHDRWLAKNHTPEENEERLDTVIKQIGPLLGF